LFDQYQNLFQFEQNQHQPNAIYCKTTGDDRWTKYFVTCKTINASRTDKDFTVLLQRYGSANLERFFLDAATNQKERETFLVEPVSSLKLVCNFKYLLCKQFHKSEKGDSISQEIYKICKISMG